MLSQSVRLAVIGLVAGVLLATGMSRLFASRLVMIDTFDARAYGGAIAVVFVACMCAAFLRARRAAQIDPIRTLRMD